jgi:hypothetical protein
MTKFLFFSEGVDDTAGDSAVWPVESFRGSDPASATTTKLYFAPSVGTGSVTTDVNDYVVVTHTGIKHQVYMKALVQAINGNKDGFIIAADLTSQLGAGSEYGVTAFDAVITFAA